MKSTAVKKWSILGLVLMAASAVTAAILPKNSDSNKLQQNGTITASDANGVESCTITGDVTGAPCYASSDAAAGDQQSHTTAGATSTTGTADNTTAAADDDAFGDS